MLTVRQFTLLIIMYELGSSLLIIPSAIAAAAKQDAWLSVILSVGLHFICIPLYAVLAKQSKQQGLGKQFIRLFGEWPGKVLLFLFILAFPYLIFICTVRNMGDFISTTILIETPIQYIHATILGTVVYAARSGLTVVGRAAEILFAVVILILLVLIGSLLPSVEWANVMPILEHGFKPVVQGSIPLLAFPFLEIILFLFIIPHLDKPEKWKNAIYKSSLISCSFYFAVIFIVVTVLTAEVSANLVFPSYFVVRTISIADFYERFEVLLAIVWFITIFFRLTMLLFIVVFGLVEVFGFKNVKTLLIPLAVIAFVMAEVIWPNVSFLIQLINVWPLYAMLFGVALPLLLWGLGVWRKSAK